MYDENRYWPFDFISPENQTDRGRQQIEFLTTAHEAGYNPYMFASENFGATAAARGGIILCRCSSRGSMWELLLGTAEETVLAAYLDDFSVAAEAVLMYLRGIEAPEILDHIRGHLCISRATGPGFRLSTRSVSVASPP